MVDNLNDIYSKPEYFAGYYLKQIPGNMLLMGDVPAEQNHSSIDGHLGKGATWDVAEHISQLLSRQKLHSKQKSESEGKLYHRIKMHDKSIITLDSVHSNNDILAKQYLSEYAYDTFWVKKTFHNSKKLTYRIDKISNMVHV